jgi:transposase InsO family protein
MRIVGYPRSFYVAAHHQPVELSAKAWDRLRWLRAWQALRGRGLTGQQAAETLHLPRSSLYRWERRLKAEGAAGLEERSRRPKRLRRPQWSPELAQAVLRVREHYPAWGKEMLQVLVAREGWQTSVSTVGRILAQLKARGVLREVARRPVSVRRHRLRREYAVRKPRDYAVAAPGDVVQVDTLDVRPLPGVAFKHFTARDMVSRWDVVQVHRRATAHAATLFLEALQARLPFPVKAIQVDGGSEFQAEFEKACAARKIRLFVLPPRSPKLNGCVERAHRTHQEEFYELYDGDLDLASVNQALLGWEKTYNTIRPHRSLAKKTPAEYLQLHHPSAAPNAVLSHMS